MRKPGKMDKRPTISEWPVRIWSMEELPQKYAASVKAWLVGDFSEYDFVYAPKRRTNEASFEYLYGYGKDKIIYMREKWTEDEKLLEGETALQIVEVKKQQVTKVRTQRELLNAKITLYYQEGAKQKELPFPYIPSVYYLYDPFLNWLLGLEKEFMPSAAERKHPRPEKLYRESLAMFNYSLGAYRLGSGFIDYQYEAKQHRSKWMPWKKILEEWLKIPMKRGLFELHSFGYLTECVYHIRE